MSDLEILKKYFYNTDIVGEFFLNKYWIKSNKFYVFICDCVEKNRTYILVSKKYYLTVELTKKEVMTVDLDNFAILMDNLRSECDLKIEKYEFWIPHCIVNSKVFNSQLIAESYGVSRELSLEYLIQYDTVFRGLYNRNKGHYFGLPLLNSYEEAEKYILKENTKEYLKGYKKLEKLKGGK